MKEKKVVVPDIIKYSGTINKIIQEVGNYILYLQDVQAEAYEERNEEKQKFAKYAEALYQELQNMLYDVNYFIEERFEQ